MACFFIAPQEAFVLDVGVNRRIFFVTGTDTGVGKTVLTSLLTQYLSKKGITAAALKPLCSGDRADAGLLREAQANSLSLDEINPWHFQAPIAPLIAARKENQRITLNQVAKHIVAFQKQFPCVLVEGAGGLLSPLGEGFDSRDLIIKLDATPLVVCPNRLGALNQIRLVLAALPNFFSRRAKVILMSEKKPDASSETNPKLLEEILGEKRIFVVPWIRGVNRGRHKHVQNVIKTLARDLLLTN